MTKKDFQAIADTISGLWGRGEHRADERRRVAVEFAEWLATTNPRFDRARFLAACGVAS